MVTRFFNIAHMDRPELVRCTPKDKGFRARYFDLQDSAASAHLRVVDWIPHRLPLVLAEKKRLFFTTITRDC